VSDPRELRTRDLPPVLAAAVFCCVLFVWHRAYVEREGALPGTVRTFEPPVDEAVLGPPFGDDAWHYVPYDPFSPATSPSYNGPFFAAGPLGPDGQVVPRQHYLRNTGGSTPWFEPVWFDADENGKTRVRFPPRGEPVGPWGVEEPVSGKSLADELRGLRQRLSKTADR
jgi:hypothetical protein